MSDLSGRLVSPAGGRPSDIKIVGFLNGEETVKVLYVGGGELRVVEINMNGEVIYPPSLRGKVIRIDQ